MKRFLLTIILLLFSANVYAQFRVETVQFPEATESDSFLVPINHHLAALHFNNTLDDDMDSCYFLIATDPTAGSWDTLYYNNVKYFVLLPDSSVTGGGAFGVTLNNDVTKYWEWWRLAFAETLADSTTFKAVYDNSKK